MTPTRTFSLGFSSCPNDTAIFYALMARRIDLGPLHFRQEIRDVEELNRMCRHGLLDISKVSFHAAGHILDRYVLLRSGAALGRGCGPLLVARPGRTLDSLETGTIAVPGRFTTAQLLLHLYTGSPLREIPMLFSEIMPCVAREEADFGLIIHEGRFTYPSYGLVQLLDLGEWWETETGLPIPLGGIVMKREHGPEWARAVEHAIQRSLEYYRNRPEEAFETIRQYAQELDPSVIQQHIDLYVNNETLRLTPTGETAIRTLLDRARAKGLIPPGNAPVFFTDS